MLKPGTATVTIGADEASPDAERAVGAPTSARQRSPWVVFATVAVALMMASIDQTIVATALPTIRHQLHSTIGWSAWTLTVYSLGSMIAMPITGSIADRYGRKLVFVGCVVAFTVASLLCGASTTIFMLVPLRFCQALAGGGFMPCATSIVSDVFGKNRDRGIGLFTSIFPIGSLIGPVLGGVIVTYWSWREIFFVNVPIGILLFFAAIKFLPRYERKEAKRIDYRGAVLLALCLSLMMYAITSVGSKNSGVTSLAFYLPLTLSVVGLVGLGRYLATTANPIVATRLLRVKQFAIMNFLNLIYGGCVVGFGALVPLYAQERYHINSLQSGTLLSARAIGAIAVAGATTFLLRRIGYRLPMAVGYSFVTVGLVGLALHPVGVSAYVWLAGGACLTGLGNGMAAPATNNAVLALAPNDIAAISGLRASFRQLGGIIAVSVASALASRSAQPGLVLGHIFLVAAVLIVCIGPLILLVPDTRADW